MSRSQYPEMEWRCSCGDRAHESGDGAGLTTIRAHQLGKTGHRIEGLYADDTPDAEILIVGAKRVAAVEAGYISVAKSDDPPPKSSARSAAGAKKSEKSSKTAKTDEGNVNLGIQFANIRLKPAIWGWLGLVMPMETRDDGTPYDNSNEGIGEWLYDVVELHGRQVLALVSQVDMGHPRIDRVTQMIRGSIRLNTLPDRVAQTPEAGSTNAEDVMAQAFRDLEDRASALALGIDGAESEDEGGWSE